MDLVLFLLLLVAGFVGCAEFASLALVHPLIRRLPLESQMLMESGLLRTYGRVMPVLMTAAPVLAGLGIRIHGTGWFLGAAIVLTLALVVTILGNVPINLWQGRADTSSVPAGFERKRRRWDVFQAIRGSLQLLGFVLVCAGAASL